MSEKLKEAGQEILAGAEVAVEALVNEKCDIVVAKVMEALAAAIPGQIDDMVIAAAMPVVQPIVKAELLKLAEQISKQV